MKREYTNFIRHSNGTYSGVQSITVFEEIYIFKDSHFNITGYHKAGHLELMELLFLTYKKNGVVVRRIFEECTFAFTDCSRSEIDDVMQKIGRQKKPSRLYYSFDACKVLNNGQEIENYPLRHDNDTIKLLKRLSLEDKEKGTHRNVQIHYNLKEMTYFSPKERPDFSTVYHNHMINKRLAWKMLKQMKSEQ